MPLLESAIGVGMGLLNNAVQNNNQISQQEKLNENQYNWDTKAADRNLNNQLKLFNATGYEAQVEQMKKAGINPALIYSKGGGQGSTATTGGGVNAPQAQQQMGLMNGMQMAAQMASIELMKAQADKAQADADKTRGADTDNTVANTGLTNTNKIIAEAEAKIKSQTTEEAIATIGLAMQNAAQELESKVRNNSINQETYEEQIKQIETNLIKTGLENAMLKQNTKKSIAEINQITNSIAQKWLSLKIDAGNARTNQQNAITQSGRLEWDKEINDVSKMTGLAVDVVTKIMQAIIFKGIKL